MGIKVCMNKDGEDGRHGTANTFRTPPNPLLSSSRVTGVNSKVGGRAGRAGGSAKATGAVDGAINVRT